MGVWGSRRVLLPHSKYQFSQRNKPYQLKPHCGDLCYDPSMRNIPLLICLCLFSSVPAVSLSAVAVFDMVGSPFLEISKPSSEWASSGKVRHPLARFMSADFLKWDPQFRPGAFSGVCRQAPADFFRWASWIESCDKDFQTRWTSGLASSVGALSLWLELFEHPFAKPVLFHLPQGLKVKGLLALKNDGIKRPLVIFRSSIFSSVSEALPERYFFMHLFEESPFHFLLLESSTGYEFIERNPQFGMGGFDEGLQNFFIAKKLTSSDEPLSQIVSSVHLSSFSLGGHSTFFSALLNVQKNQKVFSSFSSFCPLFEFERTFKFHESHKMMMQIMDTWSRVRLAPLIERYQIKSEKNFLSAVMSAVGGAYRGPLIGWTNLKLPAEQERIKNSGKTSSELFWSLNNFSSQIVQIKDPFLIFASLKDPLVPLEVNIGKVLSREYGEVPQNIQIARLSESYHCSIMVTYDWHIFGNLMREFVFRNSPEFKLQKEVRLVKLNHAEQAQDVFVDLSEEVQSREISVVLKSQKTQKDLGSLTLSLAELGYTVEETLQTWSQPKKKAFRSLLRRWILANLSLKNSERSQELEVSWMSPR